MTAEQLAGRIGVTRPRVHEIEKSEVSGAITLESLERAANALDCRLVYAFVPREPLETLVRERAEHLARRRLEHTAHSMALEDQSVDEAEQDVQFRALATKLADSQGSALWDDE